VYILLPVIANRRVCWSPDTLTWRASRIGYSCATPAAIAVPGAQETDLKYILLLFLLYFKGYETPIIHFPVNGGLNSNMDMCNAMTRVTSPLPISALDFFLQRKRTPPPPLPPNRIPPAHIPPPTMLLQGKTALITGEQKPILP